MPYHAATECHLPALPVVTDDTLGNPPSAASDPKLSHVFDGPGSVDTVDAIQLVDGSDIFYVVRDVTLAPGESASFVFYEGMTALANRVAADEAAAAVQLATDRFGQSADSLYAGLPADVVATVRNWERPAVTPSIALVGDAKDNGPVSLSASADLGASMCAVASREWTVDGAPAGSDATLTRAYSAGAHAVSLKVTSTCGTSGVAAGTLTVTHVEQQQPNNDQQNPGTTTDPHTLGVTVFSTPAKPVKVAPVRQFLREQMADVRALSRDKGGRPAVWNAEPLFGILLVQDRLARKREEACNYVRVRGHMRRLFGFPPAGDAKGNPFPDPDAVRRFEKAWAERLDGDLSALHRLAYIDAVADDLVRWNLPLDRIALDNRPCLSPQRRPDASIHASRRDDGSGPILVRRGKQHFKDNGRLKTSAISDGTHVIASRCLHDRPGEMLTEPDLYRRVLIPELARNYEELRHAVIDRGGTDPRSRRPLTLAGDNACNNVEMLQLLRLHGWYGAFRAPPERTLVGKVLLKRSHPTPGEPSDELREACDDGAWLCPCTTGIPLAERPAMTRRLRGRGELLIYCERGCVHIRKVFVVPPNPRVYRKRHGSEGDPRLSNPLPPYEPRVAAVNFMLKEAVEHHNGTLLREHGLGVKTRDQCHRFFWGQFAHDLHYMLTDALRNFDVSRNLDRLGGPGPEVPWEVAEDSAMRNHHAVGNRTGHPRSSPGWQPSPTTVGLRLKLQAELAKREGQAPLSEQWSTEWLTTPRGQLYARLLDDSVSTSGSTVGATVPGAQASVSPASEPTTASTTEASRTGSVQERFTAVLGPRTGYRRRIRRGRPGGSPSGPTGA